MMKSITLIAAACLSMFSEAGLEQKISLELMLDQHRPLEKDVFGANCLLHGRPVWYTDPSFVSVYEQAGKPFFRFPGGTAANYYNPESGLRDIVPESGRDYRRENERVKIQTNGRGRLPSGFFEFAQKVEARYSVVLNVCSRSIEQNRAWLREVAESGVDIPCFEVGNELYFGSYQWAFTEPQDYLERAKASALMIRELFPKARIGVVVPSHIYTHESFLHDDRPTHLNRQIEWMKMLEGLDFFDAVIIHLYSAMGMDSKVKAENFLPFTEAYSNAVDYLDRYLEPALDTLEKKFPGKEIWITEYGVGGFSGDLRGYGLRSSHLGALHSDLMLLRFFARPSIKVAHWHSFSHFLEYDYKNGGVGENLHLSFLHFSLFSEPVHTSTLYVPVNVNGSSEIEGGAFVGQKKGYAVLINRGAHSLSLSPLKSPKKLTITGAVQLGPRKDAPLCKALQDTAVISSIEMSGDALDLKPYSITRIKFAWE